MNGGSVVSSVASAVWPCCSLRSVFSKWKTCSSRQTELSVNSGLFCISFCYYFPCNWHVLLQKGTKKEKKKDIKIDKFASHLVWTWWDMYDLCTFPLEISEPEEQSTGAKVNITRHVIGIKHVISRCCCSQQAMRVCFWNNLLWKKETQLKLRGLLNPDKGNCETMSTSWDTGDKLKAFSAATVRALTALNIGAIFFLHGRCFSFFFPRVVTDLWPVAAWLGSAVNLLDRVLPGVRVLSGHQHWLETAHKPCTESRLWFIAC